MIPESEKKLVAPCGIYCGACNDYISYTTGDEEAMKKAVFEVSRAQGRNVAPEEIKSLINRLFSTKAPEVSPDGKPVVRIISMDEIEDKF